MGPPDAAGSKYLHPRRRMAVYLKVQPLIFRRPQSWISGHMSAKNTRAYPGYVKFE